MTINNGSNKPLPVSQIEGMQTMVPNKVTNPRSSRRILSVDCVHTDLYKQRCHVILYYKGHSSHDSGWVFAGYAKDSFGRAMEEQPIIGGRLLHRGEKIVGDMALEIVSNDSGVRLVEARIPVALSEFLDLKEKEEEAEAELVFWKDLDEKHPEFSPLLYVQVTNFQCGGYSIGISCSLLLGDPSTITSILINWSKIHTKMVSENALKALPLHYLPNLQAANTNSKFTYERIRNRTKSMIFTTKEKIPDYKDIVSICIQEAESEFGVNTTKKTCLFSVASFEKIEVENYSRESVGPKFQNKVARVDWDHFGTNEISFYEGTKPICVSNWIYSTPGEVLAILVPSSSESDSLMSIVVSIPN